MFPWLVFFRDGVQHDEHLVHDGGQSDFSGASIFDDEALIELLHHWVPADRGAGCIEENAAHARPSVSGRRPKAAFSALLGPGRETNERGDFFSGQPTELGKLAEQCVDRHRADAFEAAQELGDFGEFGGFCDMRADFGFDVVAGFFERRDERGERLTHDASCGDAGAAALGLQEVDELAPARCHLSQVVVAFDERPQAARCEFTRAESRQLPGVDLVRLALAPRRALNAAISFG